MTGSAKQSTARKTEEWMASSRSLSSGSPKAGPVGPRNDGRISMDDQKRRDDGMAQRRKVLGDAWVDKSIAGKNSFNADFIDLITRHAWGEIWTRPHFDHRTRRVLVIGTMLALGPWDEFRLHVRAALTEGGFTPIYCGVPAANHAVKEASAVL